MSSSARWTYVQARLQARHGELPQENDWRVIESARSFDHFIERANATPLRRFAGHVHARMSSHAVERLLRDAWRGCVAEVAGWVPASWRPAVLWLTYFPDLPVIEAVVLDHAPQWVAQDPVLGRLAEDRLHLRSADARADALGELASASTSEDSLAARWFAHWRSLLPRRRAADERALVDLAASIASHMKRLGRAAIEEASAPYRRDLAGRLVRMFRRQSGAPAAVFCHLALVALSLERLRGDLMRRRLFEAGHAEEAA